MCGIVGYISTKDSDHILAKRHFSDYALMLDTLRGVDSTGLVRVSNEFDVHTNHTTMSGRRYVNTDAYDKWMQERDSWAFIGHNRAATAGSVKLENAHPFTFGDVTMVHNGTLWQGGKSMPGYDPKLEVDSMQVARALSEADCDAKAVAELFNKIDGSFCLVWVDRRDQSVNMARNSSRPMHFAFNRAKNLMWFMSDGTHLHAIGKSMEKSTGALDSIYQMDKYKILKFKKGNMVPEVTTFVPFARPKTTYHTQKEVEPGKALATATKKWQNQIRTANGTSTTTDTSSSGTTGCKGMVAGHRRTVPANHIKILRQWYDIGGDDLLKFTPDTWMELANKQCVVTGMFTHPGWGDAEWPMTLYNVPLVVVNAYCEYEWAVKAKGVCSNPSDFQYGTVISLLGELYAYDWRTIAGDNTVQEEEEEEEDNQLVVGPDETLIDRKKCMSLISKGCIQCGSAISWEERSQCMNVNEGRDVLCAGCSSEWKKEAV